MILRIATIWLLLSAPLWAAVPTLVFNTGTGSDVAASGSTFPAAAVTSGGNNGAATAAASADVDLSADTPDLSGVPTDGTAVMWVDSSSGRQFSAITGVNDTTDVVTCAGTFANTESGRNWGIGGKRATFDNADSRTLFVDVQPGWTIRTETNQAITGTGITFTAAGDNTTGSIIVEGDSTSSHRVLDQAANARVFVSVAAGVHFRNLKFTNTNGTKTSADAITSTGFQRFSNCIFGDATNTLNTCVVRASNTIGATFSGCDFVSMTTGFSMVTTNMGAFTFDCCYFLNCTDGIDTSGSSNTRTLVVTNSIFKGGTNGIDLNGTGVQQILRVMNCTFDGMAIAIDAAAAGVAVDLVCRNNNFTNCTDVAFAGHAAVNACVADVDYNNFYGNNNNRTNITAGANDLAVNPEYVNASGANYQIGPNLKAKGFPLGGSRKVGAGSSATYSYVDIGAAQRPEAPRPQASVR